MFWYEYILLWILMGACAQLVFLIGSRNMGVVPKDYTTRDWKLFRLLMIGAPISFLYYVVWEFFICGFFYFIFMSWDWLSYQMIKERGKKKDESPYEY